MGGLSNSRVTTHTNRATNTLRIPKPAAEGLKFMQMNNLLSKNPQGSGGIGRMEKNSPCNCRSVVKKNVVTLEDNNLGEDSLGDNKPNVSCMQCYDASNNLGCSFKSQHNNYYCCPYGNYDDSGCSTSEHVCYINEPDNSGCLATRFSHCPSGACVWDGSEDIRNIFNKCDTVFVTADLSNINTLIVVPFNKTLIVYSDMSFIGTEGYLLSISGTMISYGNISFENITISRSIGIFVDFSGSVIFNRSVYFHKITDSYGIINRGKLTTNNIYFNGDIDNGTGIYTNKGYGYHNGNIIFNGDLINESRGILVKSDNSSIFNKIIEYNNINNSYGIKVLSGKINAKDVSFSDISNNGYGILIKDGSGSGIFNNIRYNKLLPYDGFGLDCLKDDISYSQLCGEPSGNVWPKNTDSQKHIYKCK